MTTRHNRPLSRALRQDDSGLTLIEMVVALAIVTVVLVSAAGAFAASSRGQRSAEAQDRATQYANDVLEQMRRVPWSKLGLYSGQTPGYQASAVNPDGVTEYTVNLCPTSALCAAPVGAIPKPLQTPPANLLNNFQARTDITWVRDTYPGTATAYGPASPPVPGANTYGSKRTRVTVSYTLSGKSYSIVDETVRSPGSAEQIPEAVGNPEVGTGCQLATPFCSAYVTSGEVLSKVGGDLGTTFMTTKPVQFYVSLNQPATTVRVTVGGTPVTLASGSGDLTSADGGMTFSYPLPIGSTGLLAGDRTVRMTAVVAGTPRIAEIQVDWRLPIPTPLTVTTAGLMVFNDDAIRTTINGLETSTPHLCVNYNNGQLWRSTALMFDVANIDEMDSSTTVKPTFGWTAPTVGPLTDTQFRQYTVTRKTNPGTLNTMRWYRIWPKGTLFARDATHVVATAKRPGDGAQATAQITVPVRWSRTLSGCSAATAPDIQPIFPRT